MRSPDGCCYVVTGLDASSDPVISNVVVLMMCPMVLFSMCQRSKIF